MEGRPEADNLVTIYAALEGSDRQKVLDNMAGAQFSRFKQELSDLTIAKLGPITMRLNALLSDPAELDRALAKGATHARSIAAPVLAEAAKEMGIT